MTKPDWYAALTIVSTNPESDRLPVGEGTRREKELTPVLSDPCEECVALWSATCDCVQLRDSAIAAMAQTPVFAPAFVDRRNALALATGRLVEARHREQVHQKTHQDS